MPLRVSRAPPTPRPARRNAVLSVQACGTSLIAKHSRQLIYQLSQPERARLPHQLRCGIEQDCRILYRYSFEHREDECAPWKHIDVQQGALELSGGGLG